MSRLTRTLMAVVGMTLLTGCPMPTSGTGQTNPLLQEGLSISGADPARAVVLLERALSGDPRLAEAHLELGNLHYQRTHNYAAAIYHFEKYLQLEPKSTWTNTIRPQIEQSKSELARTHLETITDSAMQRRVQSLMAERNTLTKRVEELTLEVSRVKGLLDETLRASASRAQTERGANEGSPGQTARRADPDPSPAARSPTGRTHRVRRGETLAAIGRAHRFGLAEMKAANPGINHDRLQVDQVIQLPR